MRGREMSISYLPEVESQINQYFKSQNTMALADSTKALYNAVLRKKLLPFYKIIDSMLKDFGLKTKGDRRGPHTFRHYMATNLRYNFRMDLDHVARLLGDTQKTISSRYLHPTAENVAQSNEQSIRLVKKAFLQP